MVTYYIYICVHAVMHMHVEYVAGCGFGWLLGNAGRDHLKLGAVSLICAETAIFRVQGFVLGSYYLLLTVSGYI